MIGVALSFYNFALCVLINILNLPVSNGDLLLMLLSNFILGIFVFAMRKNSWENKLHQNFMAIKNIASKEMFAYKMIECIMTNSIEDQLVLNGMLKTHKLTCFNSQCACRIKHALESISDDTHKKLLFDYKTKRN